MVFEQAVMDAYVRVSRVAGREGESFISPDVQRRQIAGWAELRGVRLAAWHEDLDVSGGRTADERPGLSAVMERIRSGQTGGVAVAKLDRLSRLGLLDSLKLIEEIRAAGGTFAALDLGVDPTTDGGEIALNVMLTLAGQQRRRIAEGWRVAQAQAVERGVYIASKAPTGYGREDGRLVVPPASSLSRAGSLPCDRKVLSDLLGEDGDFGWRRHPRSCWTRSSARSLSGSCTR